MEFLHLLDLSSTVHAVAALYILYVQYVIQWSTKNKKDVRMMRIVQSTLLLVKQRNLQSQGMRFGLSSRIPFTSLLNMSTTTIQKEPVAKCNVQYLKEGEKANFYASEPGVEETDPLGAEFLSCEIEAQNARIAGGHDDWDLDRQGFKLVDHPTAVKDFHSDKEIEEILYKEVKELITKHVKGAKRVEVFDHTKRASAPDLRKTSQGREPSAQVHNDYTGKSATKRLHDMLPEEAEELSKQRFAIVNVWRSIAGTIQTSPLAFIDSTTINAQKDLITAKRISKDRIGELQFALYDKSHKWYYFHEMNQNEAVLFKTFDSDENVNQFTLHTALNGIGNTQVPRQSIEVRSFVFFD